MSVRIRYADYYKKQDKIILGEKLYNAGISVGRYLPLYSSVYSNYHGMG